jgi:proton-dependent oligopeptide transporter, POT family
MVHGWRGLWANLRLRFALEDAARTAISPYIRITQCVIAIAALLFALTRAHGACNRQSVTLPTNNSAAEARPAPQDANPYAPPTAVVPPYGNTPAPNLPFSRLFWISLLLEFVERFAYYGVYINLSVYLIDRVGFSAKEMGSLLGVFAAARAWVPVVTGSIADKLGFRRSLLISFALYIVSYLCLFAANNQRLATLAVMFIAIAGAFLKPVIPATVRQESPAGRQETGFAYFYASVNAGSVVGKTLTKYVRLAYGVQATILNAVAACVVGLGLTFMLYRAPKVAHGAGTAPKEPSPYRDNAPSGTTDGANPPPKPSSFAMLFTRPRLFMFLLLVSGYYLLIEQFYQTFPVYITRTFGPDAPRELITLINPAAIALLQVPMGYLTKKLPPLFAMSIGVGLGAVSMLLMGSFPSLAGASISFFVFALAEMVYSPRYYQYVASFAPKGLEGATMGLALIPFGLGGLAGGFLSGHLIAKHLPTTGSLNGFAVWSTYAVIGLVCALLLFVFAAYVRKRDAIV